jgi:hypothetical protein
MRNAPLTESGAFCWFDRTSGILTSGSDVTQWTDQSPNGNHVTQATSARRPAYNANDPLLNNGPSVVFSDSTTYRNLVFGAVNTLAQPCTLLAVLSATAYGAGGHLLSCPVTTFGIRPALAFNGKGLTRISAGASVMDFLYGADLNQVVFMAAVFDGPRSAYVINWRTIPASVPNSSFATSGMPINGVLGKAATSENGFLGSLGMFALMPVAPSLGTILQTFRYIGKKISLPFQPSRTARTRVAVPAPGTVGGRTIIL